MRKNIFLALSFLFFALSVPCFSQSDAADKDGILLSSYRRNFARASISVKLDLIKTASESKDITMLNLFRDALKFVSDSYEVLGNDIQLFEIGGITVEWLGSQKDKLSKEEIKLLFINVQDEGLKISCIKALSELVEPDNDKKFIFYLNNLYENTLKASLADKPVKIELLSAYAETLGKFGDKSSFPVLMKTLIYPANSELVFAVRNALNNIHIDYFEEINAKIEDGDILYIYTLFSSAKDNPKLETAELGKIAEASFNAAIVLTDKNAGIANELKEESLKILAKLKWQKASESVVKYFYKVRADYKNGKTSSEELIKVINCMGKLGSVQCAQVIAIFLGSLNSETELKKTYEEPLVLSTISAAGELGNKIAFDYLIYTEYLNYSPEVKKAARDAAARLKW